MLFIAYCPAFCDSQVRRQHSPCSDSCTGITLAPTECTCACSSSLALNYCPCTCRKSDLHPSRCFQEICNCDRALPALNAHDIEKQQQSRRGHRQCLFVNCEPQSRCLLCYYTQACGRGAEGLRCWAASGAAAKCDPCQKNSDGTGRHGVCC